MYRTLAACTIFLSGTGANVIPDQPTPELFPCEVFDFAASPEDDPLTAEKAQDLIERGWRPDPLDSRERLYHPNCFRS